MRPGLYTRPAKPLSIPVERRRGVAPLAPREIAAPVIVDKATECHVTPPDVAERMVAIFGDCGDVMTLEPSAGTGALLTALLNAGQSPFEICAIEREVSLYRGLTLRKDLHGAGCISQCFLEYAEEWKGRGDFPRIIMNPPFRKVKQHIAAAVSLMGQQGHRESAQLVALVPITFEHPDAQTVEELPPGTFSTAPGVRTKIILIEKPGT